MFEQSLYEHEPVATPPQDGDLFYSYEIKNWVLSPRIYKILGISALANVFALFIFAQTSLLTMKGCDSPLVGRVCQVLDTVYVGSLLFGTDREYIDAAYDKTELDDAEITFIDVTGVTPPLSYPEGYFQLANPEQAMLDDSFDGQGFTSGIPGIPDGFPITTPSTGGSLLDTSPNIPSSNPNSVDGDLPTFSGSNDSVASPGVRKRRHPRGGRVTTPRATDDGSIPGIPNSNQVAEVKPSPTPTVEPAAPLDPNAINNRPLVDLSNYVNDLIDKNLYKLDSQFSINAKGKLNKEGKFDKATFKIVKAESADKTTIEVLKTAIEAINDSGRLKVLEQLTGKDLNLTLSQDAANLSVVVESELESEMRATSIKSSLDLAIALAKSTKSGANADQNDKDDLLLLENAKIETVGKKVIIRFFAPKEILLPMIQRKLAEEKAKSKQPNGNAIIKPGDNTAKK